MPTLTPVDGNPFAPQGGTLTPVDTDPFAPPGSAASGMLTDDGTVWGQQQQPSQHIPGLIERAGNAIAHPIQTIEDAWNAPGSYLGNAAASAKDAASIPGDVLTGKQPLDQSAVGRLANAAMLASGTSPAAGAVGFGARSVAAPTDDLLRAGVQGFNDWRASPLRYDPYNNANWAQQAKQDLIANGPRERAAPDLHAILDGMSSVPNGALDFTPAEQQQWRQEFSDLERSNKATNPVQSAAAGRLKRSFSDFLASTPPTSSVDGLMDPATAEAVQGYRNANANYAAGKQAQFVDNIESNADLGNDAAHSGHNGDNVLRQQVKSALRVNPITGVNMADRAGLNDASQDALRQVISPDSVWPNRIRTAGNLLGGGLGHAGALGALIAAKEGYEYGGLPGAIAGGSAPFLGTALKEAAENMTKNRLNNASEVVRQGAPLSQTGGYTSPRFSVDPQTSLKLARALAGSQWQPQEQLNAPQ